MRLPPYCSLFAQWFKRQVVGRGWLVVVVVVVAVVVVAASSGGSILGVVVGVAVG